MPFTKLEQGLFGDEEVNNIITFGLSFRENGFSDYEPVHLLLGDSIGIVAVVILIKKIINRRNKK